ncbi:unnamed protein product [Camellia sinensis]
MVQDGFEEISDAVFDIRLIVPGGRYMPIWYLILDRLQEGLPLESLGEFYSSDDYDGFDIPSPNEWKKVQGVLQELGSNLGEECRNSDVFVSNLARKMLSKLEECRKNMFIVLLIATRLFRDSTTIMQPQFPESEYCASDLSSSESDEEECESSENVIKWLQEYEVFVQSIGQPPKSELDLYLEEPVVPWSVDFSALSWWRAASSKYPTVSKMARDFLAIPISLATSFEAYYATQRPANECVVSVDRDIMNALILEDFPPNCKQPQQKKKKKKKKKKNPRKSQCESVHFHINSASRPYCIHVLCVVCLSDGNVLLVMSGNREIDDGPDTEMSGYFFGNECYGGESNDDDDDDDGDGDGDMNAVDEEEISRILAKLVCTDDDFTPRVVEDQSFLNFAHSLNPLAKLGSVETLKSNCLEFYREEKVKIKHILEKYDGQISLSVDILRSPSRQEYMCLTTHFIDDKWKLKKWVIICRVLLKDVLPKAIQKSLTYWNIGSKISTITLKHNSYNDETVEMVKDHIQKSKTLQLNGQLFHVHCCADLFNEMVQGAFDEISKIIDKVQELISWGNSLPLWYITTSRLESALELESMGEFSSQKVLDAYDVPSADEWEKVRLICKLVDKMHKVAKMLFETKYPTASIYLGNLQELRMSLTREASSSDSFISAVAEKMLKQFDEYWKDMYLVLALATVMDPQCKMKYIEYLSMKDEGGNNVTSQVSTILKAICTLFDDYSTHFLGKVNSASDSTSSGSEEVECPDSDSKEEVPVTKKSKIQEVSIQVEEGPINPNRSSHLQDYQQFIQSTSQPPKSELDWYLEEPVLPWSDHFNILKWWRAASPKYPVLSRMARDLLSIPLSVVTSYDAYYTKEREIDRRLISSGPVVMNALMCTRSWHRKH